SKGDINLGNLVYTPPLNGNNLIPLVGASFKFQVQDDGGVANGGVNLDPSTTTTIGFNVQALNDQPAGKDKTVAINEDTTYGFAAADFGFTDPADASVGQGNNFAGIIVVKAPTSGQLLLNGVTPVGDNTPVPNVALLSFKPAANANGTGYANFTFQVKD